MPGQQIGYHCSAHRPVRAAGSGPSRGLRDALERDPVARAARLPHEVFDMMRATLPQGPVLVQVPRAGYLVALVCQECREPARCGFCGGGCKQEERVVGLKAVRQRVPAEMVGVFEGELQVEVAATEGIWKQNNAIANR